MSHFFEIALGRKILMNKDVPVTDVKKAIVSKLERYFGCTAAEASRDQLYKATVMTVKDILTDKRGSFKQKRDIG